MTPVIITFIVAGVATAISLTRAVRMTALRAVAYMPSFAARDFSVPVFTGAIALVVALAGLYGLMELGARVRGLRSLP